MVEAYVGGTGDEKTDIALAQLYEDRDKMGGSVPALYVLIARVEEKLDKLLKRTAESHT